MICFLTKTCIVVVEWLSNFDKSFRWWYNTRLARDNNIAVSFIIELDRVCVWGQFHQVERLFQSVAVIYRSSGICTSFFFFFLKHSNSEERINSRDIAD